MLTERERTRTERDARDIVERRRMVAALDVKKADLAARRGCLDEAFETALAKMCAMPETEYEDYVTRLLNRYAEYGDTVVLARDARVDNSYIMALPVYEGKKLRLSRERGDFARIRAGRREIRQAFDVRGHSRFDAHRTRAVRSGRALYGVTMDTLFANAVAAERNRL